MTRGRRWTLALVALVLTASGQAVVPANAAAAPTDGSAADSRAVAGKGAVVERRVIGHSVRGRPITAWRLGVKGKRRVVLISTMHGNERRTREILAALRDGRPIKGVDLWVIPQYNPDGYAANTRKNARGVDLNRNFPYRWAPLTGATHSGPKPASEPETRAVMRFLRKVRPKRIASFHQPLYGVDTDTKNPKYARRLARKLKLPRKTFNCGGVCHGTMTGWFNHNFDGAAVTVEYGAAPSRHRMQQQAPRQVLRVFGARRVAR
ncbi:M14 family zinc carboxypeptidase [Nocardioides sp.]|uniref:M14 family zinc carboxypeptidase n=1 Tax=Nocardioides sp. TaxID=35761 RepID=UPI002736FBCA|nr:M14 family zinc carboxypeptidase [Nocardioides sp.]MDP3893529.1 DUF2817 domain-containing protein [Nocardioides sp.]